MQNSRLEPVYLYSQTPKINSYACTKSSRRVSLGPIRESLPNQSTSGSARPCNLRVRLQGKANTKQKEIGNFDNRRIFPIFVASFYPSYRPHGILTAAPGSPGAVFYCLLCGFRARICAANSGRFLHK